MTVDSSGSDQRAGSLALLLITYESLEAGENPPGSQSPVPDDPSWNPVCDGKFVVEVSVNKAQ